VTSIQNVLFNYDDFKPFFSSKYGDFGGFFPQKKSFKHLGTRFIYLFIYFVMVQIFATKKHWHS